MDRPLSPAEYRVLADYVETGHLPTTAARLNISYRTARNHLVHARKRLGMRGSVQLAYALGAGDLDADKGG